MAIRLGCVCVAGADGAVRACGRRGACVRTGVCTVRRALESAYGNRKKYRKRRKTKEKARCGGMNAAGFVELTVVETATSSMRTKRSTN